MTTSRPICACCGRPYGRRSTRLEEVRWPIGKERPAYRGNGIVVKEGKTCQTPSRADMEMHSARFSAAPSIRHEQEQETASFPAERTNTSTREIWNGKWSGGYEPFCTLRCVLAYARRAYHNANQAERRSA